MSYSIETENRRLVERYPFLLPRCGVTDEVPSDYDYSYTELDNMPDGWRFAFGEQMCEEIRDSLINEKCMNRYRILQIKEKYGALCWYDCGGTEKIRKEVVPKYEKLSARTCICCGKPATRVSTGWTLPFCDSCAGPVSAKKTVPIEKYYKEATWGDIP